MITNPSVFLSLDLEMNQPSGKIIQIGACVGNIRTGELLSTLSVIVNPGEPITPYITRLTGITQEIVDSEGVTLQEGFERLIGLYRAYKNEVFCNLLTWGGGDTQELYKRLGEVVVWPFGRRWIDVKTAFQTLQFSRQAKPQAGLAKAMTKVGLRFIGRKHNAKDDAINTFRLYSHLVRNITFSLQ